MMGKKNCIFFRKMMEKRIKKKKGVGREEPINNKLQILCKHFYGETVAHKYCNYMQLCNLPGALYLFATFCLSTHL
jgi:hypothetical protein